MGLKVAVFGQAPFGKDVLVGILEAGHEVVGVYAPPEGKRPDPFAEEAKARGLPLFRHKRFRRKGEAIPELVEEFRGLGAELAMLAFVTVILPPEIVEAPKHGSLCFHPSMLPRFRGGSALAWQIILGERESGVTVFQPDAGVDTGPILVQKGGVPIRDDDTAASLYFDRLYPLGVEACVEAVDAVAAGETCFEAQAEEEATFQGLVTEEVARIDWSQHADVIDRLVRGCDPQPGAWAMFGEEKIRCYGTQSGPAETKAIPGTVIGQQDGKVILAAHGGRLFLERVRVGDGKKVPAIEVLAPGDCLRTLHTEEEARIDWSQDAAEIARLVRDCDPQPGAWAALGDQKVRCYGGHRGLATAKKLPGSFIGEREGRAVLAAHNGRVLLERVRVGDGEVLPAVEALAPGDRLRTFYSEEEARIDWSKDAEEIAALARDCEPVPGAWAIFGGEKIRLYGTKRGTHDAKAPPGTVVGQKNGRALIAVNGGQLLVERVRFGDGEVVSAVESLAERARLR